MPHKPKGSPFWYYSISITDGDGETHKFRGSLRTKDARRARRLEERTRDELIEKVRLGQHLVENRTLQQALSEWRQNVGDRLKTGKADEHRLLSLALGLGEHTALHKIDGAMIKRYVAWRLQQPAKAWVRKDEKRPVSQTSINRDLALLRRVIRKAGAWGWRVPTIQWGEFIDISREVRRKRILTDDEEQRLADELAPHLKPLIAFTLMVGQREREVTQLTWEQVDMDGREIHFFTKSRSERNVNTVPMNDEAHAILLTRGPSASGRVFLYPAPGRRGTTTLRPFTSSKKGFKAACRRAGIKDLRFHDLRRTFATRLVRNAAPLTVVRDLLDHADTRTTERYVLTDDQDRRKAVASLVRSVRPPRLKIVGE